MNFALYGHGGSTNRGCEAIAVSTSRLIHKAYPNPDITLLSYAPEEDKEASIHSIDRIINANTEALIKNDQLLRKLSFENTRLFVLSHFSKSLADKYYFTLPYRKNSDLKKVIHDTDCFLSIGGDNYCYGTSIGYLSNFNSILKKENKKTALWGCSVGENDLTDEKLADLSTYNIITARESITYDVLNKHGLGAKTFLHCDPAFTLPTEMLPLPPEFADENTVGINISPLISSFEPEGYKGIGCRSMSILIDYILRETKLNVALIPHVFKQRDNDTDPLKQLYDSFISSDRICLIGADRRLNASQIKGYIARCSFFVGSRTHATIAAYSSCVPTLVLGYSVKSLGIARDLFGTEQGLVVPVNNLTDEYLVSRSFEYLLSNGATLRKTLIEKMPSVTASAEAAVSRLSDL